MKVHWKWYSPNRIGLPTLEAVQGEREYVMSLGDVKIGSFPAADRMHEAANAFCDLCNEVADKRDRAQGEVPVDILKFEVPSKTYEVTGLEANVVEGIGDVNGTTKGSGARYNSNKPQFDLIPVRTFIRMYEHRFDDLGEDGGHLYCALTMLANFQEGNDDAVALAMQAGSPWAKDAVRVLEFGAKKYAEWNWAKGMSWQAIIGCALRHATAALQYERLDAESGQTHLGHFLCNLVFLDHYVRVYKEGDDRPPAEFMK
jgi:hypothetical protein